MRSTYFKRALSALGVAATLFQGAFAAPAAGHNVEGRAISKGGAVGAIVCNVDVL